MCRETTGGFDQGFLEIEGTGRYSGQEVIVQFQNENLLATRKSDGGKKEVSLSHLVLISGSFHQFTSLRSTELNIQNETCYCISPVGVNDT